MKTSELDIMIIITELMKRNRLNWRIPDGRSNRVEMLQTLMTISRPMKCSDQYYEAEARYLNEKIMNKDLIDVASITEQLLDRIYICKGDITSIKADAIVNAANEKLLGCFIPGHRCIDNAIHMSAGLALRNECHELMTEQGKDEETGLAKVTKGYNLPSTYVIHTVGPNLNDGKIHPKQDVIELLGKCYISCLRAVENYKDIKNIVFCSISTGVYGVPIDLAAEVALKTLQHYLSNADHRLNKVVIDVFSQEDYNEYKERAREIRTQQQARD